MRPAPAVAISCALIVMLSSQAGCAVTPSKSGDAGTGPGTSRATTDQAGRYFTDASATPPPDASAAEKTAHAVALVRRYVDRARLGQRAEMLESYLPETRRSAETPVARDLELARSGGPLGRSVMSYLSVGLKGDRLWPPQSAELLTAEDADRLRALTGIHADAYIVLVRSRDGSSRPVFVVRSGADWWLVP